VNLDGASCCATAGPGAGLVTGRDAAGPLRVGYAARAPALLSAHRLHRCCDVLVELRADAGRARFAHPSPGSAVERAGLTAREADVVLLLCAGHTTPAVAACLCVSPATARSHRRSVLRKLGVRDRRELRALLLGGG
jgi:DNA-binding CsgD family transcriptional regulator